ncbi:hypothetical protein BZA77DRAFT_293582 [Pyronema omphalodes]|nr:hypothetical protein BZA77DRAFT_293582 [Pyronema omphalodes]
MPTRYYVLCSAPPNINKISQELGNYPDIATANHVAQGSAADLVVNLRADSKTRTGEDDKALDFRFKKWFDKDGLVHLESKLPWQDHRYRLVWVEKDIDYQKRMDNIRSR